VYLVSELNHPGARGRQDELLCKSLVRDFHFSELLGKDVLVDGLWLDYHKAMQVYPVECRCSLLFDVDKSSAWTEKNGMRYW
jgi:hypothetical protein